MYKVKRTDKGRFKEFDRETYDRERYLLQGKETLNTIIERSLIRYRSSPLWMPRRVTFSRMKL